MPQACAAASLMARCARRDVGHPRALAIFQVNYEEFSRDFGCFENGRDLFEISLLSHSGLSRRGGAHRNFSIMSRGAAGSVGLRGYSPLDHDCVSARRSGGHRELICQSVVVGHMMSFLVRRAHQPS
jgi:hypothetical protein